MIGLSNDPEVLGRVNLSGFAKTIELTRTATEMEVDLRGLPNIPDGTVVNVPIDDATDDQDNIDPSRILKWLFRKLNDALNSNDAE